MNDSSPLPCSASALADADEIPERARQQLAALRTDFDFEVRRWQVGPLNLLVGAVACSDQLMDELVELPRDDVRVKDERLPYWAEIWPSARGLAYWITQRAGELPGHTVLELGCGQGLPGVVAGLCGAQVTFSDYDETALDFARLNWLLNLAEPPTTLRIDWRDPPQRGFDLLLAADVAYEARFFAPLLHTFEQCLNPQGRIWLAEPQRPVAMPFFEHLRAHGFTIDTETVEVEAPGGLGRIDLHEIRRS